MNDEEIQKDLNYAENELFTTLVTTILYLDSNLGIPMNTIRSLITKKVNTAFTAYKENNHRKDFCIEMLDFQNDLKSKWGL